MNLSLNLRRRLSTLKLLLTSLTLLTMLSMVACVASIPVVVKYIEKERQYTAKLEVHKEAVEIYQLITREIEKLPDVKIINKDDSKFTVSASREDKATRITVLPSGTGKSMVTVTADAGKSWEESKDLANRVVKKICEEVNMQCRLVVQ